MDSVNQAMTCLMMSLGDKDVSKIKTGPLTQHTYVNWLFHNSGT